MSERLLLSTLLLALASLPAAAAPVKHTLDELIQIARVRSVAARIPEAERGVRNAQRWEALGAYAPQFELNAYLTGAPSVNCQAPLADFTPQAQALAIQQGLTLSQLRQRDCVATVDPVGGQTINVTNFAISGAGIQVDFRVTEPIYTFGKIEDGLKAADHGVAAAHAQAEGARREAELQTTRAYWGLKTARAAHDMLAEVRDKIAEWEKKISDDLETAKPKFTIYDQKRIQLALVQVDNGLADIDRNADIALAGLHLLCGADVDIDDSELDVIEPVERPMDFYVDAMVRSRPESRALEEAVGAYRALANVQRDYMFPDLAMVLNVSWRATPGANIEDSQSAYQSHANYLGFGLLLVLRESFDFAKVARWRHAEADARQWMAMRDGARAGYALEIAQAYHDLVESRKRLTMNEKGQKTARGWLSAVDQDLDASSFTMLEAARNYFSMRLDYFRAINDVNYNIARLRRASGVEVAK